MKVFIAGSRAISRLNKNITERLDKIMERQFTVLVGDANGADKAVQRYLASREYPNVMVYCMEVCRNNVGNWPTQQHSAEANAKRDRSYYGIKDQAMARDANCAFMLWDGRSKGTLTNVINLLNADKKVLVYINFKKCFFTLGTSKDLSDALQDLGVNDLSGFLSSLGMGRQGALPLTSVHTSK